MAQSLDLFYFIFSSKARRPSVEICLGSSASLSSPSSGLLSSLRVFGNITIHLFFYCLAPLMASVSCHWKKLDEDNLRDFYLLPLFIFVLKIPSLLFCLSFGCSSNHLIPTLFR